MANKIKKIKVGGVMYELDKYDDTQVSQTSDTEYAVSDPSGNVVMEVVDGGHFKTKKFDSHDVANIIADVSQSVNVGAGGTLTEYLRSLFVLIKEPSTINGKLTEIEVTAYNESANVFGIHLLIGTLDQRNWLINPRHHFIPITNPKSGTYSSYELDLTSYNINILAGEVICVYSSRASSNSILEPIGSGALLGRVGTVSDDILISNSLDGEFTSENAKKPVVLRVKIEGTKSEYFYQKKEIDEKVASIDNTTAGISATIAGMGYLTDEVTGYKYRLVVRNGTLSIRNNRYSKVLFIGSSFVTHGVSQTAQWYSTGAMAPSIIPNGMSELVLRGLQRDVPTCTMDKQGSVGWERDYDNYDLTQNWLPKIQSVNPDAIFLHVSGNSTWSQTFKQACVNMLSFLKANANADIFVAASWHGGQKATDMRAAAAEVGVTYVDLAMYKTQINYWKLGDYTYGDSDNQLHPIVNSGVAIHPNDMGCLRQANAYLLASGHEELNITKAIVINNSDGGTISTANPLWVVGGYVTLRITPDAGKVLSSISVVDGSNNAVSVEHHTNDYGEFYTFVMPDSDVNVSAVWVNV